MSDLSFASLPTHGGTDALGVPQHDFSTNRNACGPCPPALAALQAAHAEQYPDPEYTALRGHLARFHGVQDHRIVIAGSASEFIHRISAHAARCGARHASVPQHSYADYAHAARVWGLSLGLRVSHTDTCLSQGLHWACEPSSPLGEADAAAAAWRSSPCGPGVWRVLDYAYRPLRLSVPQGGGWARVRDDYAWQLWTPNKALGMTGVRAAYAIAPASVSEHELASLAALAPSWVIGSHGTAFLQAWTTDPVQAWLRQSLDHLKAWKTEQLQVCQHMGWHVVPGHQANYFVARLPESVLAKGLSVIMVGLRAHGIKLRDASSFGLPGCVRLGVLPPESQQVLMRAWNAIFTQPESSCP